MKWQLTMLLYSSSSISFTFRQYDWKAKEIYTVYQAEHKDLVEQIK